MTGTDEQPGAGGTAVAPGAVLRVGARRPSTVHAGSSRRPAPSGILAPPGLGASPRLWPGPGMTGAFLGAVSLSGGIGRGNLRISVRQWPAFPVFTLLRVAAERGRRCWPQ